MLTLRHCSKSIPMLLVTVIATCGYSAAYADSINCNKARLPDEHAICRSVELQRQDVKMTTLFEVSGHLMAMGGRGAMQDRQVEWLKDRHQCKTDLTCLRSAYALRIAELNQGLDGIYSRGPF